jgi:hypothetical protein
MKAALLALLIVAFPSLAHADPPPFDPHYFFRALVGVGSVPNLPRDDESGNVVFTAEVGGHPLSGALATGVSISTASDMLGNWYVLVPGLFAELDLTYLFLTGFWTYDPPEEFPFRLELGSRLGLARSESFRSEIPYAQPYTLFRPELGSFLDFAYPLCDCDQALVLRTAVDTSVNIETAFRWSVSVGLKAAWGQ